MGILKSQRLVLFTLALLALGGGYVVWRARPAVVGRPLGPPLVSVKAAVAERKNVPVYVRGLGAVQAFNTVRVSTRVDGQITKVFFTEGQEVKPAIRCLRSIRARSRPHWTRLRRPKNAMWRS